MESERYPKEIHQISSSHRWYRGQCTLIRSLISGRDIADVVWSTKFNANSENNENATSAEDTIFGISERENREKE